MIRNSLNTLELIKKILIATGLPFAINRYLYEKHLTILTYHGVVEHELEVADWCFLDKKSFRKQMHFIKKHFQTVKLSDGIKQLYNCDIQRPTVAITFDDGFQNNFSVAYPILKDLGIPATIFLSTGYIDSDDTMWFCRINDGIAKTSKRHFVFEGQEYAIDTSSNKIKTSKSIQNHLKDNLPEVLSEKCRVLLYTIDIDPEKKLPAQAPFRMLDHQSIREMAKSELIEFGCHTHGHCILGRLPRERCENEINRSKRLIEKLIASECKLFAYPNGRLNDIPDNFEQIMQACQIEAAVTTIGGKNDSSTPVNMLKRHGVGAWQSYADFKLMVLGLKEFARGHLDRTIGRNWRKQNE